MGWNPGANVITGDLITAAVWNSYLGATGSLEYLQSWQQNDATAARAIDGTIYQNTDDYIRIVTVTCNLEVDNDGADIFSSCRVDFYVENATPPTIEVSEVKLEPRLTPGTLVGGDNIQIKAAATFVVLPNYYYRALKNEGANTTVDLRDWFEWGPA